MPLARMAALILQPSHPDLSFRICETDDNHHGSPSGHERRRLWECGGLGHSLIHSFSTAPAQGTGQECSSGQARLGAEVHLAAPC